MGGIQWNQIAANVMTSVPSQKSGSDRPGHGDDAARRSPTAVSCRVAESTPIGMAMTRPRIIASAASSSVTGIAFLSATGMGSLVKIECPGLKRDHLPEPQEVLLVVRLVEAEVLAELRQLLLADVARLAHQRDQRVARHDAHEPEHDQRRQQQHGDRQQQPSDHVLVHAGSLDLAAPRS